MKKSSRRHNRKREPRSQRSQARVPVPHDTRTMIEEAVVWLQGIHEYSDDLTTPERDFLRKAKKNLALMYRRREP